MVSGRVGGCCVQLQGCGEWESGRVGGAVWDCRAVVSGRAEGCCVGLQAVVNGRAEGCCVGLQAVVSGRAEGCCVGLQGCGEWESGRVGGAVGVQEYW